jgi:hypothetical protein
VVWYEEVSENEEFFICFSTGAAIRKFWWQSSIRSCEAERRKELLRQKDTEVWRGAFLKVKVMSVTCRAELQTDAR